MNGSLYRKDQLLVTDIFICLSSGKRDPALGKWSPACALAFHAHTLLGNSGAVALTDRQTESCAVHISGPG